MPKNEAAGIEETPRLDADADADDDVVDLLEVVKPGIFSAQGGAFPDPTPVNHVVDPNESLDLPGMDDLDAFLSSLGAETGPDAPVSPEDKLPDTGHGMEDLDAVPALGAATSEKPDRMDADYLDSLLAEAENQGSATPATTPASLPLEDLDPLYDKMAVSPAPPQQGEEKGAPLDYALTAALDAAVTAEEDFEPDAQDVPFDAVRDAALDALLQAAQAVADDQSPPPDEADDEPFGAALDISLATAAGDIASESSGMGVFDTDAEEPPEENVARENMEGEEREVPPGGLFPEPVMEDAPLNKPAPPDGRQDSAATAQSASSSRFDEVDLDELDALLDNMLAAAPAPGRALPTRPEEAAPELADAPPTTDARPTADTDGMSKKLEAGLAYLRLDMEGLREGLAGLSTQMEQLAATGEAPSDPGIADRFQHMEEKILALETRLEEAFGLGFADRLKSMEEQIRTLEARLDELAARDEQALLGALDERLVKLETGFETRLETGLEGIEQRFAEFASAIDKAAAKAAAKVIREEIAAMMEQDG